MTSILNGKFSVEGMIEEPSCYGLCVLDSRYQSNLDHNGVRGAGTRRETTGSLKNYLIMEIVQDVKIQPPFPQALVVEQDRLSEVGTWEP